MGILDQQCWSIDNHGHGVHVVLDRLMIDVDNGGGSSDTTGPEIVSLTTSASMVSPGDTLTITAVVADPSGVDSMSFSFQRDGVQNDFCGQGPLTLTSGDEFNGTWTFDCVVPVSVINGSYEITPFAQDLLGNYTNTNGGTDDPTRANFTVA